MESWVDLARDCPIDIGRIHNYSKSFNSKINISLDDLDKAKENLLDARADFDLMVTSLIQLLYNREILIKPQDHIIFMWLREDLGRFLGKLDDKEDFLLIEADHRDVSKNRLSVSRISSYAKTLKLASSSIIYECLLKATDEYKNFKETDKLKRDKRTFLYILFQILQVTLSVIASHAREYSKSGLKKNELLNQINPNWSSMLSDRGQETIRESYKEQIGGSEEKLRILFDNDEQIEEDNQNF